MTVQACLAYVSPPVTAATGPPSHMLRRLLMAGQPGHFVHFACSDSIAHLSGAEIIPRILICFGEGNVLCAPFGGCLCKRVTR
jgi:hypothetical protein